MSGTLRAVVFALFLLAVTAAGLVGIFYASTFLHKFLILFIWAHTLFFIMTVSTCYYYRYFHGKNVQGQPPACFISAHDAKKYKGEALLHRFHRYFYWGSICFLVAFLLLGIYLNVINLDITVFSTSSILLGLFFMFWALSCHYFKYAFHRAVIQRFRAPSLSWKAGVTIYNGLSKLNHYHQYFFWGTVITLLFHYFSLNMGTMIAGVPVMAVLALASIAVLWYYFNKELRELKAARYALALVCVVLAVLVVAYLGMSFSQAKPTGVVREYNITAFQFGFDPAEITVAKGDKLILYITSTDVAHGFAINEFGINEVLEPGKTVKVEFIANRAGTFVYYCSVYCGRGHTDQKGLLIVRG